MGYVKAESFHQFSFNVYIDDLSCSLNSLNIGCNFNGLYINHLVYADDTVLLAPDPAALQKLIDHCVSFARSNDIHYNLKKTKCMYLRPREHKDLYFPKLFLNDTVVKVVSSEKYLGAFIVDDFSDDEDFCRQMKGIYARGNILIKNFKHCSSDIKTLLFKTYCTGFYGSALWCHYKVKSFNKVRVAYNNIFRIFMGLDRKCSISKAMIDLHVDPFQVVFRKYIVSFIKRLDTS